MTPLQLYTRRILARWRLIALLTVIGAAAAGVWSFTSVATTWTATSALTAQSQERSPEQDAVLALGYVDYFNQASYQELLGNEISIPEGVTLTATTGATSPILYIQASGSDEGAVRAAAAAAADRFQQDVRQSLNQERDTAANDLQQQIDGYSAQLQQEGLSNDERAVIFDQIRSLQGRITDIRSDNTNMLKPLQPEPGVASATASPVVDVATGAVGGAVLGVLVALLLCVLDKRVGGPADVSQRLGTGTVIELGRRQSADERALRIEQLVNKLSLVGAAERTVIAVVGVRAGAIAPVFARQLAATCATRRSGALLVLSDVRRKGYEGRMGLVEVLDGWTSLRSTLLRVGGLHVLPPGSVGARDPYAVIDPRQLVPFLASAGRVHPVVVIDAPPLLDASESQILCAAADQVIVVAEPGQTSLTDARRALALLDEVKATVGGVALVSPEREPRGPGRPEEPVEARPVEARPSRPTQPKAPDEVTARVPVPRTAPQRRPGSLAPDDLSTAEDRTVMMEVQPRTKPGAAVPAPPTGPVTAARQVPPAGKAAQPSKAEQSPRTEQLDPTGQAAKTGSAQAVPAKAEAAKPEAGKPEAAKPEQAGVEPAKVEPGKPGPAVVGAAKPELAKAESRPSEPPTKIDVAKPVTAANPGPPRGATADDESEEAEEERHPVAVNGGVAPHPRPRPRPQPVSSQRAAE